MSMRGSKIACLGSGSNHDIATIEDIVENILSRLPANSVLKCKLVSKLWCRLIREPQFAQLQFFNSPKNPMVILQLSWNELEAANLYLMDPGGKITPYTTLPYPIRHRPLQLIALFNGLICCIKFVSAQEMVIEICNPATWEVLELPKGSPPAAIPTVGIIFDPDRNKYQVLHFFDDKREPVETQKCEIYTPESRDWREVSGIVERPTANPVCPAFPTHICVGGRMYWLVWSIEGFDIPPDYFPDHILSIDMDGNILRLELPGAPDEESGKFGMLTFLVEYKGRLSLVCVDDDQIYVRYGH